MSLSIVLVSGGIDSAVALASEVRHHSPIALTINYGQRNQLELIAARRICARLKVEQRVARLDVGHLVPSPLTGVGDIPTRTLEELRQNVVSPAYVPARNTMFLATAIGLAESLRADRIVIGATKEDQGGFPDCRQAFFDAMERVAWVGTTSHAGRLGKLEIGSPFLQVRKHEIIERGVAMGVPFHETISCYQPVTEGGSPSNKGAELVPRIEKVVHCGRCDACVLRREAFVLAKVEDPTHYKADL